MRWAVLLLALAACGKTGAPGPALHGTRQQPSVTEPGIHIGGYANVGVLRMF